MPDGWLQRSHTRQEGHESYARMAGAPDLLDVGVDVVGKAAGRIAFTGAEIEGFIGSVALFQPLAIWSIKVGDAVAIGGNEGRAIIRIIGDGAVRRAQRGADRLVAIGIIAKTPAPGGLDGMGPDRGRSLGGIDIGAQARVGSQVPGKVIAKSLAERGGVGIGRAQRPETHPSYCGFDMFIDLKQTINTLPVEEVSMRAQFRSGNSTPI